MTINTALHQRVSTFSERCLGYQDGPAREPWLLQWSELRLVHLRFPRHSVFFSVWIFWKFSFSVWDLLELPVSPVVSEHFFFRDLCNRSWFQPPNGIMASVKLECPKTGQQHLCFFCVNRILIHCHLTVTWCYLCPHVCWLYPKFSWFLPSKFERCVHPHWSMGSRI